MAYEIIIPKTAQKQMDNLQPAIQEKVIQKLELLENDPRPSWCIKLKSYKDEYRIRIGDYRIRYQINDSEFKVILLHCKHRKDIYE